MPTVAKTCDVYQGYNYKKDTQATVGFITKLKLDKDELKADQKCKDPTSPETDISAVAVMSGFFWDSGVTDSLSLDGQITIENRQLLKSLLYASLTNIEVDLQFCIYEYDPIAKKYFKSCQAEQVLKCLVEKSEGDLRVLVADNPSRRVQSPENYMFQIGVVPQPTAQMIQLAVSDTMKVVKQWGAAAS